jgi:hypothetical protein
VSGRAIPPRLIHTKGKKKMNRENRHRVEQIIFDLLNKIGWVFHREYKEPTDKWYFSYAEEDGPAFQLEVKLIQFTRRMQVAFDLFIPGETDPVSFAFETFRNLSKLSAMFPDMEMQAAYYAEQKRITQEAQIAKMEASLANFNPKGNVSKVSL